LHAARGRGQKARLVFPRAPYENRAVPPPDFILIVEDDQDVREALSTLLQESGYPIQTAGNGKEALAVMQERLPCLVLLDLMMPVMSGWALTKAMRADERLRQVPICIVSAVTAQAPAEVQHVLRKPIQVGKLLDTVASYCNIG
jgi:CheY-like chemotaxis protein